MTKNTPGFIGYYHKDSNFETICALLRAILSFWLNLINTMDKNKALLTCILDQVWRNSMILWLDLVLFCWMELG